MLSITKKVVALEPEELTVLERIITDDDREEALSLVRDVLFPLSLLRSG